MYFINGYRWWVSVGVDSKIKKKKPDLYPLIRVPILYHDYQAGPALSEVVCGHPLPTLMPLAPARRAHVLITTAITLVAI
jgi:hypothetical protein